MSDGVSGGHRAAAGVLLWLCGAAAFAQVPEVPVFGGLRIGMTLDEVRAALPVAAWEEGDRLKFSQRPTTLRAPAAVEFAGARHDAKVMAGYRGRYELDLRREFASGSAAACEAAGRELIVATEAQLGPLRGPDPVVTGEERERIGVASTVTVSQAIGANPMTRRQVRGRDPDQFFLRARGGGAVLPGGESIDVLVLLDYRRGTAPDCFAELRASRSATPAPAQALEFASLRATAEPSIAMKHVAMATHAALVRPEGLAFRYRCQVERATGVAFDCRQDSPPIDATAPPAPLAALRPALHEMAKAHRFDLSAVPGLDRDDPQPVEVLIPISLQPGDLRPTDFVQSGDLQLEPHFRWQRRVGPDPSSYYPTRALRAGENAAVEMACQIQADLSPVCAPLPSVPRAPPDFEQAVMRLMASYRADPTAADGSSTVGRIKLARVEFRLGD